MNAVDNGQFHRTNGFRIMLLVPFARDFYSVFLFHKVHQFNIYTTNFISITLLKSNFRIYNFHTIPWSLNCISGLH